MEAEIDLSRSNYYNVLSIRISGSCTDGKSAPAAKDIQTVSLSLTSPTICINVLVRMLLRNVIDFQHFITSILSVL